MMAGGSHETCTAEFLRRLLPLFVLDIASSELGPADSSQQRRVSRQTSWGEFVKAKVRT